MDTQENQIIKAGGLHLVHWCVIGLSLLLTFGAWYIAQQQVEEKTEIQFNREAERVLELVMDRMQKYEDGLWGGVAAIQTMGGDMTHSEWQTFANSLRIDIKYPGINGIGVIHRIAQENLQSYLAQQRQARPNYRIHPQHHESEYWPITLIEPVSVNAKAVGLDMAHETNRYTAAKKARDTGEAQITGPIVLVQDSAKTPGFLFYAPFYSNGVYKTKEERQQNIIGLVYAPFVFNKLIAGVLEKDRRHVSIKISDAKVEDVLYDENLSSNSDYDTNPLYKKSYTIDLYGRTWGFEIASALSFRKATASNQPLVILFGGICIDLLLLSIFILLSRSNRRAVNLAAKMTQTLHDQTMALEASNEQLEKFAYITSHDLKTPLRGMNDLREYLAEDLDDYLQSPGANPDVKYNLERMEKQIQRMDNLIVGILHYSSIDKEPTKIEPLDLKDFVAELSQELAIGPGKVSLEGGPLTIDTDTIQFSQVMQNLISNAVKYHHNLEQARIKISIKENGAFFHIAVADNGPGIEPQYHDKVFDVFQTLQSKDVVESTGIGLSIVKKIIENRDGKIDISKTPGGGATFNFSWPKPSSQVH